MSNQPHFRHVLTAAHCLGTNSGGLSKVGDPETVILGQVQHAVQSRTADCPQVAINVTVSPPGVEVKVESIVAHPEYTQLLVSVSKGCHSKNVIFTRPGTFRLSVCLSVCPTRKLHDRVVGSKSS